MTSRSAIGGVFACATLTLLVSVGTDTAYAQQANTGGSPFGSLAGVTIPVKAGSGTPSLVGPPEAGGTPPPNAVGGAASDESAAAQPTAHAAPIPRPAPASRHATRTRSAKADTGKLKAAAAPQPQAPSSPAAIPASGDTATADQTATVAAVPPPQPVADAAQAGTVVNINNASAAALNQLGMGRIGKTIVSHRPYRSIEDLVDRKVLRSSDFQKLRSKITVEKTS